ncbi:BAG family molecular chaperone regulator 1 [Zostera marina]|uniref:BAG family molecular chaperone regulator 1 n=1 Tax=Zostera marina TaxID=29655 RepID=A0A0K9P3L4_ZOSMR|nr:BAG family molecular chaperone regulator 1 [Zostera marina]
MLRSRRGNLAETKGNNLPALIPIMEVSSDMPATVRSGTVDKKFPKFDVGAAKQQQKPGEGGELDEWEVRPGGMLVQKRDPDADTNARPPPLPIRVRVKYGLVYHEIHISPQASIGELKKLLSTRIGLHHEDMKMMFKKKEKSSSAFLDISGVKDRSKLVVVENPAGQAKRVLEMRRTAKIEKASKSVSQISLQVDRLGGQVSLLESIISKRKKVAEKDVLGLTEQLMNLLVKLDGTVVSDENVKLQRGIQVGRVQKYVETLDELKMKNASPAEEAPKQWESFDLLSSTPSTSTTTAAKASTTTAAAAVETASNHIPRFDWELF